MIDYHERLPASYILTWKLVERVVTFETQYPV